MATGLARSAIGLAAWTLGACVYPSDRPSNNPGLRATGQAELDALPAEFTLLSWNTHKRANPRFDAELERFAAGVELLALQEASEAAPTWSVLPATRSWTLVVAFELGRARTASGVATGSKAATQDQRALLSPTREPVTATPKSTLLTWIPIDGADQPVLLVNLHAINFRPAAALDAQLRALDPTLDGHQGPLIVAGDFNTWSRKRSQVVEDFAARHQLSSAFIDAEQAAPRLDHVYVRGLIVTHVRVEPSRSSDHDAVRVELQLPRVGPRAAPRAAP
jgi:endonuclease/exonuclease/phosphatase (EEP) superfamily protein YafD